MAQISAAQVKELRDKTGAAMGACKKALIETDGDVEKAVDVLRSKGVKPDQATRKTAEGAVVLKLSGDGKSVALVELKCETDFAAKSENFQKLIGTIADAVLEANPASLDDASALPPVAEGLQEARAITIRENVVLSRAECRSLEGDGRIGTYVHHNKRVGVAIGAQASADVSGKDGFEELLKNLAMHATAHVPNPIAVSKDAVPQDLVERERSVALKQIDEDEKLKAKPDNVKQKMIDGKLRKFFEERALLEQKYVRDPSQKVGKLLEASGKDLGGDISIAWFVRLEVGS